MSTQVRDEDFGQQSKLTVRIRDILDAYPQGVTIFKELAQNADDAGASQLKFCYQNVQFESKSMKYSTLADFQGPSLICYNNSTFRESDFESICNIGDSVKRNEESKAGQFGLGFNAVYHLTDVPSFVTGEDMIYLDPHAKYIENINPLKPGKRFKFTQPDSFSQYSDQFKPFMMFGNDMKNSLNGTLFRFPLRTQKQGEASEISKFVCTKDKISAMIEELCSELPLFLLFLKNIESIEVYRQDKADAPPKLLHGAYITNMCEEIKRQRKFLDDPQPDTHVSFCLDIEQKQAVGQGSKAKWLISNYFGTEELKKRALNDPHSILKLVPWGGVASKIEEKQIADQNLQHGGAFCLLPLPIETKLPVHVNGYYCVSQNRRDIWWGADLRGDSKARWSEIVLRDIISKAYVRFLLDAQKYCKGQSNCFLYNLWPREITLEKWNVVTKSTLKLLLDEKVIYSPVNNGVWLQANEVIFPSYNNHVDQILIKSGLKIAIDFPVSLKELLATVERSKIREAAPSFVTKWLIEQKRLPPTCNHNDAKCLLEFCTTGCDRNDFEFEEFDGFPILPLCDQKYGCLHVGKSKKHAATHYYLASTEELSLLSKVKNKLILMSSLSASAKKFLNRLINKRVLSCNVFKVDSKSFAKLLPEVLKFSISRGGVACKIPQVEVGEYFGYLERLWKHIKGYDLQHFEQLPIVPCENNTVCALEKRAGLMYCSRQVNHWSEVKQLLLDLGCHFVVKPKEFGNYFNEFSCLGIISTLTNLYDDRKGKLLQQLEQASSQQKRALLRLFVEEYSNDVESIGFLKQLPIFEVHQQAIQNGSHETKGDTGSFVDLLSCRYILSASLPEGLPDSMILKCNEREYNKIRFLKLLGVQELPLHQFYMKHIFPKLQNLPKDLRDKAMLDLLQHRMSSLFESNAEFLPCLKQLAFIPDGTGNIKRASELHDPCKELRQILDSDEYFPSMPFDSKEVVRYLCDIGLQTALHLPVIISAAKDIEAKKNDPLSYSRALKLLTYLDKNADKVFSSDQLIPNQESLKQLRSMQWLPVRAQDEKKNEKKFASALTTRLPRDAKLVSASLQVLAQDVNSKELENIMGWDSKIPCEALCKQLLHYVSQTPEDSKQEIIFELYELLFDRFADEADLQCMKALLGPDQEWVLVEGQFVKPKFVALKSLLQVSVSPYLFELPSRLAKYEGLFLSLGVSKEFNEEHMLHILKSISVSGKDFKTQQPRPLSKKDLDFVLKILQYWEGRDISKEVRQQILVPTADSMMVPACDTVYDDIGNAPKLPLLRFLHPSVSANLAISLGVNSYRQRLLRECQISGPKQPSCPSFHIIKAALGDVAPDLREDFNWLTDLIEAADLGRATEFKLILDDTKSKQNSPKGLINSSFVETFENPSIWVHFNSVLTPTDLQALQQVIDSEHYRVRVKDHTSNFGHGLLSCYYLTDCISVLSGENLTVFDPVGKHLITPPILKLESKELGDEPEERPVAQSYSLAELNKYFPEHLKRFAQLPFGYKSANSFSGTIIHLPLRQRPSSISDTYFFSDTILKSLGHFDKVKTGALLFSSHLQSILLLHHLSGKVQQLCHIKYAKAPKANLLSSVKQTQQSQVTTAKLAYHSTEEKCDYTETWILSQATGFGLSSSEKEKRVAYVTVAGMVDSTRQDKQDHSLHCYNLPTVKTMRNPVMIYGYFYPESKTQGLRKLEFESDSSQHTINKELLGIHAAERYRDLLLHFRDHYADFNAKPQDLYDLWPVSNKSIYDKYLLPAFYEAIKSKSLVLLADNTFVTLQDAVFPDCDQTPDYERICQFVVPTGRLCSGLNQILGDLKIFSKIHLVDSTYIVEELKMRSKHFQEKLQQLVNQKQCDVLFLLLEYLRAEKFEDLIGAPLVLLESNKIVSWEKGLYLEASPESRSLFPQHDLYLHADFVGEKNKYYSWHDLCRKFDLICVGEQLNKLIDSRFCNKLSIPWVTESKGIEGFQEGLPTKQWIEKFFQLFSLQETFEAQQLRKFPLVPLLCKDQSSRALMAVSHVFEVPLAFDLNLREAFFDLNIPVIDTLLISELVGVHFKSLAITHFDYVQINSGISTIPFDRLSACGAQALGRYFAPNIWEASNFWVKHQNSKDIFRQMPIFPVLGNVFDSRQSDKSIGSALTSGKYCKLNQFQRPFVYSSSLSLPSDFISYLKVRGALVLDELEYLYSVLEIPKKNDQQVFQEYTIPFLKEHEANEEFLDFLVEKWQFIETKELQQALSECEFIPATTGECVLAAKDPEEKGTGKRQETKLCAPHALLNPSKEIFAQVFFQNFQFPAGRYASYKWIGFLAKLKLRQYISSQFYLTMARTFENQQRLLTTQTLLASYNLVKCLGTEHLTFDEAELKELHQINFVPVFSIKKQAFLLEAFKNIAHIQHKNLLWKVAPIISPQLVPPANFLCHMYQPTPDRVLQHVQKLSESNVASWHLDSPQEYCKEHKDTPADPWKLDTPEQQSSDILNYFQQNWSQIKLDDISGVKEAKMIFVGNQFVEPGRLRLNMKVNLAPLYYVVPRVYGAYEKLLKDLGVAEEASNKEYMRYLQMLSEERKDETLNVNELRAANTVVHSLLEQDDFDITQEPMYLVDENDRLVQASNCVYDDLPWLSQRIKRNKLSFAPPSIRQSDCIKMGAKLLSQCVVEKVLGDLCIDGSDVSESIIPLLNLIKCKEFAQGIASQNQFQHRSAYAVPSWQIVHSILKRCDFICVSSLNTDILVNEESITANSETDYFIEMKEIAQPQHGEQKGQEQELEAPEQEEQDEQEKEQDEEDKNLLVDQDDTPVKIQNDLPLMEATVYGKFSTNPSQLLIAQVIVEILSKQLKKEYDFQINVKDVLLLLTAQTPTAIHDQLQKLGVSINSAKIEPARGTAGAKVKRCDAMSSESDINHRYVQHEIIAWRANEQDHWRYGSVQKISDTKYGIAEIQVKTGPREHKKFPSTNLRYFIGTINPRQSVDGINNDDEAEEKVDEKQVLVEAVNKLLALAGIRISVENKQMLLNMTHENEEKAKELQRLKDQLKMVEEAEQCIVCKYNKIDTTLFPCGHHICSDCEPKLQPHICPTCRTKITSTANYYSKLSK